MKQNLYLALVLGVLAFPAFAEENKADDEGSSLMEEGVKLFMRGLFEEMEPALEDLRGLTDDIEPAVRGFAHEMGPAFAELFGKIEDFSAYNAPEILPNGDIIMRKKKSEEIVGDPDSEVDI